MPDSVPANPVPPTFWPVIFMVQSLAMAVPPSSMTTCLMTLMVGSMSSLVMVQLFTSPRASVMVPSAAQSPVMVAA